jgi:CTP:molybdopterin cytidylyltransferase MocA
MTHAERGTRNAEHKVYALVLAAGSGSRFGGDKLTAPLHGRPLIAHVAAALAQTIGTGTLAGGIAVVPAEATSLAWPLDTAGLGLVVNPNPAEGIASSLRLGLAGLSQLDSPAAALIVLADQPGLRTDVIGRLVEAWRRDRRSVRPRYAASPEEPGHPVLLDRSQWPLAERLQGDTGLRPLLDAAGITTIDVPGANPDVDTREDLQILEESG